MVSSVMLPAYPIELRPCSGTKPLHQLTGMLHQVTNGVDLKLHCDQVVPKPLWFFQLQLWHSLDYLLLAKRQVLEDGIFVVRLALVTFWSRKIFVSVPVLGPRNGGGSGLLKIF